MSKTIEDYYALQENEIKNKKLKLKENIEFYGLVLLNMGLISILVYLFKTTNFFL